MKNDMIISISIDLSGKLARKKVRNQEEKCQEYPRGFKTSSRAFQSLLGGGGGLKRF